MRSRSPVKNENAVDGGHGPANPLRIAVTVDSSGRGNKRERERFDKERTDSHRGQNAQTGVRISFDLRMSLKYVD